MNKVNDVSSVNFTSLRPKKLLGEAVLREFKNEMGYLKSSTYLGYRIVKNESILPIKLEENLLSKCIKLHKDIYDSFIVNDCLSSKFNSLDEFNEQLVRNIKRKGNKANCWEDMMIIYTKLLKKGETPLNLSIDVFDRNHFTTVFGLKKGAKLEKPSTWGSKAMIVDAWFGNGFVKPAKEALKEIELILCVGRKNPQQVKYKKAPGVLVSIKK